MTALPRPLLLILLFAAPRAGSAQEVGYEEAGRSLRLLLEQLVAADTSNPPGNEARAAAVGAARLKKEGIPYELTEFAPGRQNLVARLKGSGAAQPLLLLAHIDVVPATGQPWTSPPQKLTESRGYLVGRGVLDDLAMAATSLETLVLLKRAQTPLRRDVIVAWTGDEESGGAGIRHLLQARPASLGAGAALNEGGGVVLGEDGKPKLVNLQVAEKVYQDFELTARGPTGHSSVPLADNAIYRLAKALDRLSRHRFPVRLLPVTRAYLEARGAVEPGALGEAMRSLSRAQGRLAASALKVLEADPILDAGLRTTCVATMLSGGTRVNALPAEAKANVNCRILPDEATADVRRELERVIGDPEVLVVATADLSSAPPSPLDGEVPDAVRKVAARMWPGVPVVPFMSRGATDSRFLRASGVPAYGLVPVAVAEVDARRAHGVDERLPASSLGPGLEFLHRLVLELAAEPSGAR